MLDDDDGKAGFREAVVSAIVRVHRSVRTVGEKLGRRTGRRTFVSPRDYLDFVHHFKTLYESKRRELEDQQLHLNIGLDKLEDTQREVGQALLSLLCFYLRLCVHVQPHVAVNVRVGRR